MITIQGLTKRQHRLMDHLWACQDMDEVLSFIESLKDPQDQRDCHSLVWIAQVDTLEEEGGLNALQGTYNSIIRRVRG